AVATQRRGRRVPRSWKDLAR
ncbi:crossover junction endodeoxyribonuclease RuvC, partial [Xylella fastidiosa subsp. multiplex]|nr:crossover junction endodeoxyribonuclease RuvC [Xylella fastidiosa subsp. multiplex]